ncbi:NAD(P)/FAD-dependent oxidoreductase [Iamia sp.]|uniref:flavin-containing monooxygenase n=1 Tax=Iamia sp. TaxID=2722710 RepID=UPI002C67AA8C|nr:NAD(P)/FAD-dependent oxidoreductase [Iamia sp.]HXH57459.1 NAD(P)/FAD-dependent oxidoreductase [Iamia sp.]
MEHLDVLVVGAGISGIGAGYHLQTLSSDRSYAILEGRNDLGGTWDLFRYPGVRSDSDMHTLGYAFQPWTEAKSIADGPSILAYLRATAAEHGIDRRIRFGHQVTQAEWSSEDATWTVTAERTDLGETVTLTCSYLFMCSGYYSYKGGYTPELPGRDRFAGEVVHPQGWPEDLDHEDARVVVIGSGATAMTLVPALAETARHVTMLQRSPTYVASRPDHDAVANRLRRVLPDRWAYAITRWKNVRLQELIYRKTRTEPGKVKEKLLGMVRTELGDDYDVDTHFTPTYDPWDQRLCLVPNSDLFAAIRSGRASVVTDQIETFTEDGIALRSGEELEADIIVTATGLQLVTLGEMDFVLDGEPVDFSRTWTYKGLAYSDVPNLASSFGYVNASWTLRADLTCTYVCRLLNHMAATGTDQCTPRLRPADRSMPERPWIDDFSAGYMQRMMPLLPKQGDRVPWVSTQSYTQDKKLLRRSPVDDGVMQFTSSRVSATAS